jgi:hypothetical protein
VFVGMSALGPWGFVVLIARFPGPQLYCIAHLEPTGELDRVLKGENLQRQWYMPGRAIRQHAKAELIGRRHR